MILLPAALLLWHRRPRRSALCARLAARHVILSRCILGLFFHIVPFRRFVSVPAEPQSSTGINTAGRSRRWIHRCSAPLVTRRQVPAVLCGAPARRVRAAHPP